MQDPLRLVQITDCHLYDDPAERYEGIDTDASLAAVVDCLSDADPAPDAVLATGDLADTPTPAVYRRLRAQFDRVGAPVYCLAGNHDDPETLRAHLPGGRVRADREARWKNWDLLMLDTHVAGEPGGRLSGAELARLDTWLAAARGRHVLVALHHPPVSVGSPWMDRMGLANGGEFFDVLDRHDTVRAIVWGHVHQTFESTRRGVWLLGAPSTCAQFLPGADDYAIDRQPPGWRWLTLHADGRVTTRVERLAPPAC